MQYKSFMEALKGKQHKIDKNKNGKIDAHDFKLLRKEESVAEGYEDHHLFPDYMQKILKKNEQSPEEKAKHAAKAAALSANAKPAAPRKLEPYKPLGGRDEHSGRSYSEETEQTAESFEFNRAALAKQRLQNLRHAGRKVRGASVANLMRAAGLKEEEMDEQDLDQLDEVLSKDATASDWIHDFVHSTNPKFEGKSKKERIKMALGAYYGQAREKQQNEAKVPEPTGDLKDACWKGYTAVGMKMKNGRKVPNCVPMKEETDTSEKESMAENQLHFIKYAAEEILEYIKMGGQIEEWYQNKLSKVQSEVESLHSYVEGESRRTGMKEERVAKPVNVDKVHAAGQEPHEEKFQTYKKKTVKEQYDEEGNVTYEKVSFAQFMEGMTATQVRPGVTRYTGGSYGSAKGAKYGNTDYDKETLDHKDDEGSEEPQKRGRGRPAGSKSGARGPRIK